MLHLSSPPLRICDCYNHLCLGSVGMDLFSSPEGCGFRSYDWQTNRIIVGPLINILNPNCSWDGYAEWPAFRPQAALTCTSL